MRTNILSSLIYINLQIMTEYISQKQGEIVPLTFWQYRNVNFILKYDVQDAYDV